MTREEILREALRCVTGEREQQYGSPEDSFEVIANFWMVYLTNRCVGGNADVCVSVEDVTGLSSLTPRPSRWLVSSPTAKVTR